MKSKVIMIGIAAMLFSLTSFLFTLGIPAGKMKKAVNYRKNFSNRGEVSKRIINLNNFWGIQNKFYLFLDSKNFVEDMLPHKVAI